MPPIKIYDPRTIPTREGPWLVNAGSNTQLPAEAIEFVENYDIDHSMYSLCQGTFTWQSMTSWYGTQPMDCFLKKGGVLKFYRIINMTPEFKMALLAYNQARINKPWWEHLYNWVGIVGQAIHVPWISMPGLFYCSQVVIDGCKNSLPSGLIQQVIDFITKADPNSNPAVWDKYLLANGQCVELVYTWDSITGIVA